MATRAHRRRNLLSSLKAKFQGQSGQGHKRFFCGALKERGAFSDQPERRPSSWCYRLLSHGHFCSIAAPERRGYPSRRMSDTVPVPTPLALGEAPAAEALLSLVYEELRKLAADRMANEAAGHTLQPTALVHEAWLRLVRGNDQQFENRAHFFAAAAEAMRRILIDHARRKSAHKHGGRLERVDLEQIDGPARADDDTLLRVNDSLDALTREDAKAAELVKLRFFGGLSVEEAAGVLGVTDRTARRYWRFARAWLLDALSSSAK